MARRSARKGVTEKKQPEATSQEQRAARLAQTRNLKMARSAHAYVRGSTVKFYEWLEASASKVPEGPPVWICGDCHVGNLGPLADAKGWVTIQIRDLDQTVIGNPAHDIIRTRSIPRVCGTRFEIYLALPRHEYLSSWSPGMRRPSPTTLNSVWTRAIVQREYRISLNILFDAAGGTLLWSGWKRSSRFFRWERSSGP